MLMIGAAIVWICSNHNFQCEMFEAHFLASGKHCKRSIYLDLAMADSLTYFSQFCIYWELQFGMSLRPCTFLRRNPWRVPALSGYTFWSSPHTLRDQRLFDHFIC